MRGQDTRASLYPQSPGCPPPPQLPVSQSPLLPHGGSRHVVASRHFRLPGHVIVVGAGHAALEPVQSEPVICPELHVVAEQTNVFGRYAHAPAPLQPFTHGPVPHSAFGSEPAVAPTQLVPLVTWQMGQDAT